MSERDAYTEADLKAARAHGRREAEEHSAERIAELEQQIAELEADEPAPATNFPRQV